MRKYPQDRCENSDPFSRYVRRRNPQEKDRRPHVPNSKPNRSFDRPPVKPKSKETPSLDLVPNYEQPALPYYVVPVLYVPQKVLSNEEILPSNSFQNKNRSLFASCVRQTKQQTRVLFEEHDIPVVTCSIDPQTVIKHQRDPYEIFSDCYARPNLDEGDYNEEETIEVEEEEEEEEIEDVNDEAECSGTSVREEEEELNVAESVVYEKGYDIKPARHFTSQPAYMCYQNNQEYFRSRPNKSTQILSPPQNYQYKSDNYNYIPRPRSNPVTEKISPVFFQTGPINYGGDVHRNQSYWEPYVEQPRHPVKLNDFPEPQTFHDAFYEAEPFYYDHRQDYNIAVKPGNFKPKTNYTLMQRYGGNTRDKPPEVRSSTDDDREPKSEKRLTCEDILRNYMQEKQISLESIRKTESVLSGGTTSTKKSSFNTPPCKECPSNPTDTIEDTTIIETGAAAKVESQPTLTSSKILKTTSTNKLEDDKTKLSCTESTVTQSANSSTVSASIANTSSAEQTNSALANFVKTLSKTVLATKTPSETSTLKETPSNCNSLKETGAKLEERELYTTTATSQSVLDTKSTQTVHSEAVITTSSVSTQTEPKPEEKEVDLGKLLRNKESNKTLPDIDIFKPLTKPRDFSPSTFFQKFRKQSKLYAGVDQVKEKKSKPEGGQQKLAGVASASRPPPPKASTGNPSKLKKVKKK